MISNVSNVSNVIKQNVGIDPAKNDFKAVFSVKYGCGRTTVAGSRSFINNPKGFGEFVDRCKGKRDCPEIFFTMEATGVYCEGLARHLHENRCGNVCVVLPNIAKQYSNSLGKKAKTDKIDAKTLSSMGLERTLRVRVPASGNLLVLKQLTRERDALVKSGTVALNVKHAYSHGGKPNDALIDRSDKLVVFMTNQIKDIESEIAKLIESDAEPKRKIAFMQSIPGVGLLTAAGVAAETNGFATVSNVKQLTSYAGLDARVDESGERKSKGKITRRGNAHIGRALYMPSQSAIVHNAGLRPFHERLKAKKGVGMIALVAVQRKLLALMYALWKKEENYRSAND